MKKLGVLIILLIIVSNFLFSEDLANIPSGFIDIGFGARALAMGGAYTALADDAYSISWNPSGIALQNSGQSLAFSSVKMMNLINYHNLGYSMSFLSGISVGLMAVYSGDDAMSETTIYYTNAIQGKSFENLAKNFRFIRKLCLGINLKYFTNSYGNNSSGSYIDSYGEHQVSGSAGGFGLDFGFNYELSPTARFGVMYRNLINKINWESKNGTGTAKGNYTENLPAELILGYSKSSKTVVFAMDYYKSLYDDVDDAIHMGIEFPFLKRYFGNHILLRSGYSQELMKAENQSYYFGGGTNFNIFKNGMFSMDIGYQVQTIWKGNNNLKISFDLAI